METPADTIVETPAETAAKKIVGTLVPKMGAKME